MKQPIQKNMFVPCQSNGDIMEKPKSCDKSCSPIDYCIGGKCSIEGCYGQDLEYEESCNTILFQGWGFFTNSLSKSETGIANEVTNGSVTIYFYKDNFPLLVKEGESIFTRVRIKTIEDLLKSEVEFNLTDNFKKIIKL
jgi:hypothetical protein